MVSFTIPSRTKFIAFHTVFRYWVGEKVDLDTSTLDNFFSQIAQPVYFYENDLYTLCFCHTGLIMLHIAELETEEDHLSGFQNKLDKIEREIEELDNEDNQYESRWAELEKNINFLRNEDIQFNREAMKVDTPKWGKYLDSINSLYFILTSNSSNFSNISHFRTPPKYMFDVSRLIFKEGVAKMYTQMMLGDITSAYNAFDSSDVLLSPENWKIVPKSVFDEINSQFYTVASEKKLTARLSQLLKASHEFENHNFAYGLLLAWIIVESILSERWDNYIYKKNTTLVNGSKRINKARFKTLTGRDYPVSVISNVLELNNEISHEQFIEINKIRTQRNKIVHGHQQYKCSKGDCKKALETALKLVAEETMLNLEWRFGLRTTILY